MKQKYLYLEFLRIFATLFVVLNHVAIAAVNYFSMSISNIDKITGYLIRNISHFAVPIFVMITGYLLLNPEKNVDYNKIKNYIIRMTVILFTFGTIFAWIELLFNEKTLNISQLFTSIYNVIIGNSWEHMWYLYTLIGLYLITPIIRIFIKGSTRKDIMYFLILAIIFLSLFPMIKNIFNIKVGFDIPISTIYPFYYILGYYLGSSKKEYNNLEIASLIIISMFIIIVSTILSINLESKILMSLSDYNSFIIVILSIGIFLISKKYDFLANKYNNKIIDFLSRVSFGVYIIHMFFINIIYKALNLNPFTNSIYFVLVTILVCVLSILSSYTMIRIPILKKYI